MKISVGCVWLWSFKALCVRWCFELQLSSSSWTFGIDIMRHRQSILSTSLVHRINQSVRSTYSLHKRSMSPTIDYELHFMCNTNWLMNVGTRHNIPPIFVDSVAVVIDFIWLLCVKFLSMRILCSWIRIFDVISCVICTYGLSSIY